MMYSFIKAVALDRLESEIRNSAITVALDYTTATGTSVDIYFKASLSTEEQTILNDLVSAHVATPLPHNVVIKTEVVSAPATASKITPDGKRLFKRVHGQKDMLEVGENFIDFVMPHGHAKFMAIEFINTTLGDTVDLTVHDDQFGTYSANIVGGGPNYMLSQFGYSANMAKDYYKHYSEFDADVYGGMVIRIKYTSTSAKELGINYVMNEVVG